MAMFGGGDTSMTIVVKAKNEAAKVFKDMEKNLKTFSGKVQKMQPAFKKMALIGTASFGAISVGVKKAIDQARDFEEETNKFNVVFKDVSVEAEKMADNLNKNYRLSRLESKKLLSATGDILTGFGFTGKAALDLSGSVNTLAVDLASFTNAQGGAEAVSSALTKALLGERESLKTYGIAIQEVDVQAELLAQGMSELTGEALRQAKAQVTLTLIQRQSKNAIGDTARSTGSLKATQDQLRATTADLSLAIGETLTPVLNAFLQKVLPVINSMKNWVEEHPKLTKVMIIAAAALSALLVVIGLIGLALPAIITGFSLLLSPVGLIIVAVGLLTVAGITLVKNWDKIVKFFGKIIKSLGKLMFAFVKDQISNFGNFGKNLFRVFKSIGQALTGNFDEAKETLKETVTGMLSNTLGQLGEMSLDIKDWGAGVVESIKNTSELFSAKVQEGTDSVKGSLNDMASSGSKAVEALGKATKDEAEEISKSIKAISETFGDLKSSFQKLQDFDLEGSKKRLEFSENLAGAFVDQEEKVAELKKQMSAETDFVKRTALEQELKREEEALRKRKAIEIAHQDLVENIRKERMLTEFERTVRDIQSKHELFQLEFDQKREIILEELKMNEQKFKDLIELEEGFAIDALDITKQLTTDKIAEYDREIKKLEELAAAIAKANRVQSTGSLSLVGSQSREHGGVVPGPKGVPVPIIAHGQEEIIPAGKTGKDRGNISLIINNPMFRNNEDETRLKQQLDKYFRPLITNHKLSL